MVLEMFQRKDADVRAARREAWKSIKEDLYMIRLNGDNLFSVAYL